MLTLDQQIPNKLPIWYPWRNQWAWPPFTKQSNSPSFFGSLYSKFPQHNHPPAIYSQIAFICEWIVIFLITYIHFMQRNATRSC